MNSTFFQSNLFILFQKGAAFGGMLFYDRYWLDECTMPILSPKSVDFKQVKKTFFATRRFAERPVSERGMGKILLHLWRKFFCPSSLGLKDWCSHETCWKTMAQSVFEWPILPSHQKSSDGKRPSAQKFLDTPLILCVGSRVIHRPLINEWITE